MSPDLEKSIATRLNLLGLKAPADSPDDKAYRDDLSKWVRGEYCMVLVRRPGDSHMFLTDPLPQTFFDRYHQPN